MAELAKVREDEYPKLYGALHLIDVDSGLTPPPERIYYVPAKYAESLEDFEAALSTLMHNLVVVGEEQALLLAANPHLAEVHEFLNHFINDFNGE